MPELGKEVDEVPAGKVPVGKVPVGKVPENSGDL